MRRIDAESETLIVQDVAHALRADGFDASEDGTGRGTPLVAVPILEAGARTGKSTDDPRAGIGIGEDGDPMFTLQSGKQHAVAFTSKDYGADASDEISPTLRSMGHDRSHANGGGQLAVVFDTTQITSKTNRSNPQPGAPCHTLAKGAHAPAIATQMAVRRLTPTECERLQGFPDGYTNVEFRGKTAADGPRYKSLGNSMAVPVMRWILERAAQVLEAK